jgi:molybdopterin molybdotransferase
MCPRSRQVPRMTAKTKDRPAPTSLTDALAILDRVAPIEPHEQDLSGALGYTLAKDARADTTLRLTGARLRRIDIALLTSFGISRVSIRAPNVVIIHPSSGKTVAALIANAIEAEGGVAKKSASGFSLEIARKDANVDAIIGLGDDAEPDNASQRSLTNLGRVEFDGVALSPGGTIVFGYIDSLPVLLLPGYMHPTLAAWLAVGRRLLARLSFRLIEEQPFLLELARPIASPRGVAEIVPVRRRAAQVEPFTQDAWSPESIAHADGWILVPAETENLPAGTKVQMRPWP